MRVRCETDNGAKNVLTLNPYIHQKGQKISNYYINDQTLLRIIKLLYKLTVTLVCLFTTRLKLKI